jgi:hypothetical protein
VGRVDEGCSEKLDERGESPLYTQHPAFSPIHPAEGDSRTADDACSHARRPTEGAGQSSKVRLGPAQLEVVPMEMVLQDLVDPSGKEEGVESGAAPELVSEQLGQACEVDQEVDAGREAFDAGHGFRTRRPFD